MKKIALLFFISCTASKYNSKDVFLTHIAASKETLQKIISNEIVSVSAPSSIIVIQQFVQHPVTYYSTAYVIYHQTRVGKLWQPVDTFFRESSTSYFPQIQEVVICENTIVIKVLLAKDVVVHKQYLYMHNHWILQ